MLTCTCCLPWPTCASHACSESPQSRGVRVTPSPGCPTPRFEPKINPGGAARELDKPGVVHVAGGFVWTARDTHERLSEQRVIQFRRWLSSGMSVANTPGRVQDINKMSYFCCCFLPQAELFVVLQTTYSFSLLLLVQGFQYFYMLLRARLLVRSCWFGGCQLWKNLVMWELKDVYQFLS